jgi:hypothetical protein
VDVNSRRKGRRLFLALYLPTALSACLQLLSGLLRAALLRHQVLVRQACLRFNWPVTVDRSILKEHKNGS